MVKLIKNPLPQGINIKTREDWSNGSPVREQLERESYSKCYICEDKSGSLTVDHIKPQNLYPDLTYNWDNLLLACEHCNGVKGSRYANIINPVECDPESEILFAGMQLNRVSISANTNTREVTDTVEKGMRNDRATTKLMPLATLTYQKFKYPKIHLYTKIILPKTSNNVMHFHTQYPVPSGAVCQGWIFIWYKMGKFTKY